MILSHTHSDHSGGLYLFPHARFFAGPGEFQWAANPSPASAHLFMPDDFATPTVKAFDWSTVTTPTHDLFGDDSIVIHHTPGHTPGELSALVRLPSQNIVLSGDAAHLRESLEWKAPDPSDWDIDQARHSLVSLEQLAKREEARIWVGHDERDWVDFGAGAALS